MPTNRYDEMLSDELRDPELASEYLTAALENGSTRGFVRALKNVVDAHGGIDVLLEFTGLSRHVVDDLFSGNKGVGFEHVLAILEVLGIRLKFDPEDKEQ